MSDGRRVRQRRSVMSLRLIMCGVNRAKRRGSTCTYIINIDSEKLIFIEAALWTPVPSFAQQLSMFGLETAPTLGSKLGECLV